MKNVSAYYLLLLYSLATCKPILPFINDFFAHTFLKTNHIKSVHHDHGDDHVHYEYLDIENENGKEQKNLPTRLFESVSVHIIIDQDQNLFDKANMDSPPSSYFYGLPHPIMDLAIPPPKA